MQQLHFKSDGRRRTVNQYFSKIVFKNYIFRQICSIHVEQFRMSVFLLFNTVEMRIFSGDMQQISIELRIIRAVLCLIEHEIKVDAL